MITTGKINIAGALHAIDTTGIVAYSGDVYDPVINKSQREINNILYQQSDIKDGFGYDKVTINQNIVNGTNILEQSILEKNHCIYVILYDFDLNEKDIIIPNDCILYFQGGSLKNGTLKYQNTYIDGKYNIKCKCRGHILNEIVTPQMYGGGIQENKDISVSIQTALNYNNLNIYIPKGEYYWKNTVKLKDGMNIHGDSIDQDVYNKNIYENDHIQIMCKVAFVGVNSNGNDFKYYEEYTGNSVILKNLHFRFDYELENSIFILGILYKSILQSINVVYASYIIKGGIRSITKIKDCRFASIRNTVIFGDCWDSQISNNHISGCSYYITTNNGQESIKLSRPCFYDGMGYDEESITNRVTHYHDIISTNITNNFFDYFDTIYRICRYNGWRDNVMSNGNTYDMFRYFITGKGYNGTYENPIFYTCNSGMTFISNSDVFNICISNGSLGTEDIFLDIAGIDVSNGTVGSTDHHLFNANNEWSDSNSNILKYKYIIINYVQSIRSELGEYQCFGHATQNSYLQINSMFSTFCKYIIYSETPIEFKSDNQRLNGSNLNQNISRSICIIGGNKDQYVFPSVLVKSDQVTTNENFGKWIANNQLIRWVLPKFEDLNDIVVTSLPTSELFDGRCVILETNNEPHMYNNGQWRPQRIDINAQDDTLHINLNY